MPPLPQINAALQQQEIGGKWKPLGNVHFLREYMIPVGGEMIHFGEGGNELTEYMGHAWDLPMGFACLAALGR